MVMNLDKSRGNEVELRPYRVFLVLAQQDCPAPRVTAFASAFGTRGLD